MVEVLAFGVGAILGLVLDLCSEISLDSGRDQTQVGSEQNKHLITVISLLVFFFLTWYNLKTLNVILPGRKALA